MTGKVGKGVTQDLKQRGNGDLSKPSNPSSETCSQSPFCTPVSYRSTVSVLRSGIASSYIAAENE